MRNVMGARRPEYKGKQLETQVMSKVMDAMENAMGTMVDVV